MRVCARMHAHIHRQASRHGYKVLIVTFCLAYHVILHLTPTALRLCKLSLAQIMISTLNCLMYHSCGSNYSGCVHISHWNRSNRNLAQRINNKFCVKLWKSAGEMCAMLSDTCHRTYVQRKYLSGMNNSRTSEKLWKDNGKSSRKKMPISYENVEKMCNFVCWDMAKQSTMLIM